MISGKTLLPAPASTPGYFTPRRILVVDDDEDIRRLVCETLTESGFAVDEAADGEEGWGRVQSNNYDLLITDNSMPRLTGLQLLAKLRVAHLDLPIIMATGIPPTTEFVQNPCLIPDAVLVKPYTMDELLETVNSVLEGS